MKNLQKYAKTITEKKGIVGAGFDSLNNLLHYLLKK